MSHKVRRFNGALFALVVGTLPGAKEPKAACIVSRKVSTRAVVRNRIKRRCREMVRPRMDVVTAGTALLFYAQKAVKTASLGDIGEDIVALLRKAGIS